MEQRELSPIEKDIAEVAKLLNAEYIESLKEKSKTPYKIGLQRSWVW